MIAVIDYRAGNLTSVMKGLTAAGAEPFVTNNPADLTTADGAVVPGVGHFAATTAIDDEMREAIHGVVNAGRPLLGVCLGMQFLFEGSDEAPDTAGLSLLAGRCTRLTGTLKVPHVGWNDLTVTRPSRLLDGLPSSPQVYFTHSYAAPLSDATVAATEYGSTFATVVEKGNVFGVQFHPEKSSSVGLQILRTFVSITRSPDSPISRCCANA